jgi:transcriptional regulator with XRE-family HTH domain
MKNINIKKLFGLRIKNIRKKRGLTQSKVAEMVGVEPKHISCIESGKSFPSLMLIENLSQVFKVHPKELFEFIEPPTVKELKNEVINLLNKATDEEVEKIFTYAKFIMG